MLQSNVAWRRRFQLLIKPSHYDDDGYVIRWWRAMTPSNSLAAVYGIAADCAERRVLGPDVDIDIEVIDETNTRIDIPALLFAGCPCHIAANAAPDTIIYPGLIDWSLSMPKPKRMLPCHSLWCSSRLSRHAICTIGDICDLPSSPEGAIKIDQIRCDLRVAVGKVVLALK